MTTTAFSNRVFNLMQIRVWNVAPATAPAGGGGGGGAPAGANAASFGAPEHVPELTFVAEPAVNDNGFIRTAFLYHETYGLNPVLVSSFEDLVQRLSQNTGHIDRMRIVSHFFLDDASVHPSHLNMAFFTPPAGGVQGGQGVPRFTLAGHFLFGVSDDAGLSFMVGDWIRNVTGHIAPQVPINTSTPATTRSLMTVVLGVLRQTNAAVLQPFSLQGANSNPSGHVEQFIRYCCDRLFLDHATLEIAEAQNPSNTIPMPAGGRTAIEDFLNSKIAEYRGRIVNAQITEQNANDLRNAIIGVSLNDFPVPMNGLGSMAALFDASFLRNHNTFRTQLAAVKQRFDENSIIDIRGCRVGQDQGYLTAVQGFFGSTGHLPKVTAPEWFQSFGFLGFSGSTGENGLNGLFNSGLGRFTAADVQREFSNWSGRVGIASHISFWTALAAADPLQFLAFEWRNNLPGLAMEAVRLDGFSSLSFPDAVQRVAELFNITGAPVPAPADLQTFATNIQPHLAALRQLDAAVSLMSASTPQADVTARLAPLQQVAQDLGQTLPAAPNPVTIAYLSSGIQQLKTFVTGQLNIAPFLQALTQKLGAAPVGFRYLLNIGLPLPVQRAASEQESSLFLNTTLRDDAVKSWLKVHWAEPLPAGGTSTINGLSVNWGSNAPHTEPNGPGPNDDTLTDRGRAFQVAELSNDRQRTIQVFNPMYEYQQHIKSTP